MVRPEPSTQMPVSPFRLAFPMYRLAFRNRLPVPSAFTPNNDGNNDCFGLKYWGSVQSLELAVFNRQGLRVFFTTDPQQCWDGTYKGKAQPAGAYVYQIRATTACGTAYRKGTVILVR
jgi:gliding motility-associated-like protein